VQPNHKHLMRVLYVEQGQDVAVTACVRSACSRSRLTAAIRGSCTAQERTKLELPGNAPSNTHIAVRGRKACAQPPDNLKSTCKSQAGPYGPVGIPTWSKAAKPDAFCTTQLSVESPAPRPIKQNQLRPCTYICMPVGYRPATATWHTLHAVSHCIG